MQIIAEKDVCELIQQKDKSIARIVNVSYPDSSLNPVWILMDKGEEEDKSRIIDFLRSNGVTSDNMRISGYKKAEEEN